MNINSVNVNSHSPNEILNNFATIFENSRDIGDLISLKDGLNITSSVDLNRLFKIGN